MRNVIFISLFLCLYVHVEASPQTLTFVELNCENLFDTRHDEGRQDREFMPDGTRRWSPARYWRKLNAIGQELLSCDERRLPDLVALCEVENDSVLRDLTRRSLLRNAGYRYLMTESPDVRGLDVALLYQPASFAPICYDALAVPVLPGMRPTRDVLYVQGRTISGDTLHVFVVHAPSRYGGERVTRPFRLQVARVVAQHIERIRFHSPQARIVVAGDFNDYASSPSLKFLAGIPLVNVTASASGPHGARGSYRYQGRWQSLDHILVSPSLQPHVRSAGIHAPAFLLEEDTRYGGYKPRRTFNGLHYQRGFSDHLPLVIHFKF